MLPSPAPLLRWTTDIVAAYAEHQPMSSDELVSLIGTVHAALAGLGRKPEQPQAKPLEPAVPIRKSVQSDFLICLNDGKRFRSLKRHLKSRYGLTPDAYRQMWGLPADYPMVAPGYARERSQLAKAMGLGLQRRRKPA